MRPTCLWLALVGAILGILLRRLAASSAHVACSARRAARHGAAARPLPSEWSWHDVDASAAAARGVPPGCYATRVHNQHRAGWCGACYLMAVVHMITDRWHVRIGDGPGRGMAEMRPFVELDAQRMLDEYDTYRSATPGQAGWNACRGGDPLRVLAALESGGVRILRAPAVGYAWRGFPSARRAHEPSATHNDPGAVHVRIAAHGRLPNRRDDVMRAIYDDGPVAVGIDAECLLRCDAEGVADVRSTARRNHAATIIGWVRRRGELMWICRNSWGDHVPENLPTDTTCVTPGSNLCDPGWQPWVGMPQMPGHVLIPMRYLEMDCADAEGDSPFYACSLLIEAGAH